MAYLHVLAVTSDLETIRRNGLLMLAAASLPGVRTDVRRAFRQRGAKWDRTIASDEILSRQIDGFPAFAKLA